MAEPIKDPEVKFTQVCFFISEISETTTTSARFLKDPDKLICVMPVPVQTCTFSIIFRLYICIGYSHIPWDCKKINVSGLYNNRNAWFNYSNVKFDFCTSTGVMHQSFETPTPTRPENTGAFNTSVNKTVVNAKDYIISRQLYLAKRKYSCTISTPWRP